MNPSQPPPGEPLPSSIGIRSWIQTAAWTASLWGLILYPALGLAWQESETTPAKTSPDFKTVIQPILEVHCIRCHGRERAEGDYRLDVRAAALGSAASADTPILPGDSANSSLVEWISGEEPDMPAEGEPLSAEQIEQIRQWIDAGAPWPDELAGETSPEVDLWSIKPLQNAAPPASSPDARRHPIDAFVDQSLHRVGLQRSPPADRVTQIRRLYLDVWGLPPTPEAVRHFVDDPSPDAYEQLVDRLLAHPHYGERWAQHWLDLVRFAESNGFETNVERTTAFHYRDWVIDSLNRDLPYSEFVAAQIAGDQLGHDVATGFLVAGAWDEVKSPDVNLTLMQREDELADMVGTTSTTFLGLTLACARCHHHKFDPLTQADYFRMKALLAGVQHGERMITSSRTQQVQQELDAIWTQRQALRGQALRDEPLAIPPSTADVVLATEVETPVDETPRRAAPDEGASVDAGQRISTDPPQRPPVNARENVDRFPSRPARFIRLVIRATNSAEPCIDELEVWGCREPGQPLENLALASQGAVATSSGDYPDRSKHKLEGANDGRYGNDYSWISNESGGGWLQIELPQTSHIESVVWGRDRERVYADRLAVSYLIQTATKPGAWETVASEHDRLPFGSQSPNETDTQTAQSDERAGATGVEAVSPSIATRNVTAREQIAALDERLASLRVELQRSQRAYAGRFETPPTIHRLYRGEPQSPREIVNPDVPEILGSLNLPAEGSDAERRLALAHWLASDRNPLVWRVIANRVWQHHFGRGIVSTPSDFGTQGALPTHPELLDWLAQELIEHGGSLKHLHRLILTSETYRQSSRPDPKAEAIDADGIWYWRFTPRRGEAEVIRDSLLAVAGQLDRSQGGPGFSVFEPNTNYVRVYEPKSSFGPAEFRRMIYMMRIRMEPDGTFGAFDSPDGGLVCPARSRSTTPIQAFQLLNSPFVMERAEAFAKRVQQEAGPSLTDQIHRAFWLAFGRGPEPDEFSAAAELVDKYGLAALGRGLFNASEFLIIP